MLVAHVWLVAIRRLECKELECKIQISLDLVQRELVVLLLISPRALHYTTKVHDDSGAFTVQRVLNINHNPLISIALLSLCIAGRGCVCSLHAPQPIA